jgi:hypothetical protein
MLEMRNGLIVSPTVTLSSLFLIVLLSYCPGSFADGIVIDKVYHPYVQPLEQEFEWRLVAQDQQRNRKDNIQVHRMAYGRSINDRWFAEIYLLAEKDVDDSLSIEAYEIETKWQLSEQGELWADWAVVFEIEKEAHEDSWEFAAGLIGEKEWGKWSGTANLFAGKEWGNDIRNEWESKLNLQMRYRYSPALEPALELYSGEDTKGIGPILLGQIALGAGAVRRLKWEFGVIFGLDGESPDHTLRTLLELEF